MKLATTLTLLGSMATAIPGCGGSDAPSTPAPMGSAGSAGSSAGSAAVAGSSPVGGGGSTSAAGSSAVAGGGSTSSAGASTAGGSGGSGGTTSAAGATGSGGSGGLAPLQECAGKASIDRITMWTATNGECVCTPTGNILTKEGDKNVAKVVFMGSDWHVVPVLITNQFGKTADLSAAPGITLTYSATSLLHVQVRAGEPNWSGGDKWAADVPSTNGMKQTLFIPFETSKWASLFGTPAISLQETLKKVQGLVFVGNSANTVVFYGLRVQGFEPACP